jgi:hypothetical protein
MSCETLPPLILLMNGTFTETGKLDMGTSLDLNTLYSMPNDIGVAVGYIILEIASLLTSKAAPGLVVIVLLSLLGVASIYLMFRVIERAQALDWFYHIITSRESEADFDHFARERGRFRRRDRRCRSVD